MLVHFICVTCLYIQAFFFVLSKNVQVEYLKDLQPFYTILLAADQTERGTAAIRLRRVGHPPSLRANSPQETMSLDRPGGGAPPRSHAQQLAQDGGLHDGAVVAGRSQRLGRRSGDGRARSLPRHHDRYPNSGGHASGGGGHGGGHGGGGGVRWADSVEGGRSDDASDGPWDDAAVDECVGVGVQS
jgi:uncharacterized membrane protein YgcG